MFSKRRITEICKAKLELSSFFGRRALLNAIAMGVDLLHNPTVVAGLIFTTFVFAPVFVRNKQLELRRRQNGFGLPVKYHASDPFMGFHYVVKMSGDNSVTQHNYVQYL